MKANAIALAMLVAVSAGVAFSEEPDLLSDQSDGILELQGESSIFLRDLVGTFSFRLGKDGEIRYAARDRENRRETIPVELWLDGSELIFMAPEESIDTPRLIEITVPPEMEVSVQAVGSIVRANGIRGNLSVVGEALDVDARGVIGDVFLDLVSSKATLVGIDKALDLNLEETDLRIDQASGPVRMTQRKGRSEIVQVYGDVELDVDEGFVSGNHIEGVLEFFANRTSSDWIQLRGGGNLQLTESPLIVSESQGVLEIDSDASIEFRRITGALRIRGFGGSVRGTGATATVEVETSDAEVVLESISGPLIVKGSGLEVAIRKSKNSVRLETQSSTILLDEAGGTVEVSNDYGDLTILNASQSVKVDSSQGNVELRKLRGSLQLKADGPQVSVDWAELVGDQESTIENPGGTVELRVPQGAGGCTVEAVSDYGEILSRIPGVELDGGSSRANVVIRAPKPKIKVSAGGDISLSLGDVAPDADRPPARPTRR